MKTCVACKKEKEYNDYHKDKYAKDGYCNVRSWLFKLSQKDTCWKNNIGPVVFWEHTYLSSRMKSGSIPLRVAKL